MARTIPTCKRARRALAFAVVAFAAPGVANADGNEGDTPLSAYARGRAAGGSGDVAVAARAYRLALDARPGDGVVAVRALRDGLASGDMALASRAAKILRGADVAPADVAVLELAEAVVRDDAPAIDAALGRFAGTPLDFLAPMVAAWRHPEQVPSQADGGIGRRYAAENRVLLDLAAGRVDAGLIGARVLLAATSGGRDLRLGASELLLGQGRSAQARALSDLSPEAFATLKPAARDLRFGASRLFARIATDLTAEGTEPLAIMLSRAALLIDPTLHRARLPLADALARLGAIDAAQAAVAAVPVGNAVHVDAGAMGVRLLARADRTDAAIAAAARLSGEPVGDGNAARLYGDLLLDAGRPLDAVDAYRTALRRAGSEADWTLYLQLGGALERSGNWPEAVALLRRATGMAPSEPAALNYLGYAQLERGENVAAATRMIEQANRLRPDDPSITDSLGWARMVGGDARAALPLLERAVRGAPDDPTIGEHLGDVYWRLGRRYEARYAWAAAAQSAGPAEADRIAAKLAKGGATR